MDGTLVQILQELFKLSQEVARLTREGLEKDREISELRKSRPYAHERALEPESSREPRQDRVGVG